ncbi:MAG: GlcNAc-PI de-N-acetylase [Anaerolineales bacterium]|nr:GlcNAc-PI de-N-acetylase [Anaerolineales bacterium]
MTTEGKRLLAVFAHPDDESFGPGGTLAMYAKQGVEVHLICATRGEVGNIPESMVGKEGSVAELREAELRCAAFHLGLSGVHFLDYRDSGMPGTEDNHHPRALVAAPLEEVAAKIVHYIRLIRPHVIITFDPDGGYGHPDHIAVNRATVEAFDAASDPNRFTDDLPPYQAQKLYFAAFPHTLLRLLIRILPILRQDPERFGRNKDINLIEIAGSEYPIHARINVSSVAKIKERAAACHASQLDGGIARHGLMGWFFRLISRHETFMRAHPPAPATLREADLFTNVRLSSTQMEISPSAPTHTTTIEQRS